LTDTSVYSPNILLYDPHNTHLLVRGKNIYLAIAKLLKWSLVWYFDDISLDIVKIHVTQNGSDDYDDKIIWKMMIILSMLTAIKLIWVMITTT